MRDCDAKTVSGCGRRLCRSEILLPLSRALLAVLGFAAVLMLGSLAIGGGAADAAAPADPVKSVALLNVQFINDHADLEPTTSAERARLTFDRVAFQSEARSLRPI